MTDFLSVNVNDHTERKGNLTYLSWAWAWAEVLKVDPEADWHPVEYHGETGMLQPCMWLPDGSAMVQVRVTIEGKTKSAVLPVMDNRNQAIKQPNAFAINTAIMRCLTKAIAMFGLGLYIYAGEDVPEGETPASKATAPVQPTAPATTATTPPAPSVTVSTPAGAKPCTDDQWHALQRLAPLLIQGWEQPAVTFQQAADWIREAQTELRNGAPA